jgi:hypothetical protein
MSSPALEQVKMPPDQFLEIAHAIRNPTLMSARADQVSPPARSRGGECEIGSALDKFRLPANFTRQY